LRNQNISVRASNLLWLYNTMKKQTVLLLITKSNFGGAQRYVYDLATNLSPERFTVTVALGGNGPLVTKLTDAGVRVITITGLIRDVSLRAELKATREIADIIRTEKPDILHVNSSKAGALGALLGRLLRVPRVVFTAHGWAFNEDRSWIARFVLKWVHWCTVLLTHCTITVSDTVRTQMNWWGVQRKMQTVHLGRQAISLYPRSDARQQLANLQPALGQYQADTWLMSIGELHPVKRHIDVIVALASLVTTYPRLRYCIIGEGELRPLLEQQIAKYALTEHVLLLGHLDSAAHYLSAADIFVFPSRSEALGYAAIEAAQAGLPIVASKVGGIPEIVTHDQTGLLIPPENPAMLRAALEQYLSDPMLAARHGQAAQAESTRFSISTMVSQTTTVYQG